MNFNTIDISPWDQHNKNPLDLPTRSISVMVKNIPPSQTIQVKQSKPKSYLLTDTRSNLSHNFIVDAPLRYVYNQIRKSQQRKQQNRRQYNKLKKRQNPKDLALKRINNIKRQIQRCERWYQQPRLPKISLF